MTTLDNVNLFAVGGATDDSQDPLYPEYLELVKRFEALKDMPTIPGGYPDAPTFANFKRDKENQLARQTLGTELKARNVKKAYEEGFTQLPIGEQLAYYMYPVTGAPIETYETGYFTDQAGLGIKTPKEMLVDVLNPTKNIFQKSFVKAEDPLSAAIAPLSALGALGGIGELANIPKAGLMALRRMNQKTMDGGGGGGIGGLPATTLDEDVNKFARDGDFVSPTVEALIRNAPKNIKGKQIIEYLNSKGAPSAGIKPKELPYLNIEKFIEENPNATLPEVIEHAGKNKVEVGEVVYRDIGTEGSDFYFDRSTPELDPIDSSYKNNQSMVDMVRDDIEVYEEDLVDLYNAYRTQKYRTQKYSEAGIPPKIYNYSEITDEGLAQLDIDRDTLIETLGDELYKDNPYILIEPKGEGFRGGDKTFAFGNDDVGYTTFINGERIKMSDYGYDDVAYSANEAEIRLQRILEEREDIDIGMYSGDQKYKNYVDETLPGGKNYSEKVYTFDNTDEFAPPMGHFDEDTQIAHKLGRDRILEDGTVSVHADEIQSDFHKVGKRKGYKDPEQDADDVIKLGRMSSKISMDFKELKDKVLPILDESSIDRGRLANIETLVANAEKLYGQSPQSRLSIVRIGQARQNMYDALEEVGKDPNHKFFDFAEGADAFNEALELATIRENRVPNFPFKGDDYGEMVLKKMILDAINEGKDAISVSASTPILARYRMTPGSDEAQFFERFYDKTLPKSMDKLAKKYGGKFERGKLDVDDTLGEVDMNNISNSTGLGPDDVYTILDTNILRITPEMKAKIIKEGLPLFYMGGKVTKSNSMDRPIVGNRREM